ncbi:hypothetical protein PGDDIFCJ_00129 [Thermus phage YS40_Isch]|nr:hypothetical protein PGDDIFCJ_00129 [Thermus phage YS40_Isch]
MKVNLLPERISMHLDYNTFDEEKEKLNRKISTSSRPR